MPVPVEVKFDVDTRIPNVLAILPLPGRPLAPGTTYTCVVTTSVSGPGGAVQPSTDWTSVRDGASANSDADAIFDPVVSTLVGHGVPAGSIAGMTVFTTQSTTTDLLTIQSTVLPAQAVPTADFTSRPELVFSGSGRLDALLGARPHAHLAAVATGFYGSARFQTHDPGGDGPLADFASRCATDPATPRIENAEAMSTTVYVVGFDPSERAWVRAALGRSARIQDAPCRGSGRTRQAAPASQ